MGFAIPIHLHQTFTSIACYKCGVVFAVDSDLHSNWKRDSTQFWCPNGHSQSYTESEADRLKRQLAAMERERDFQKSRAEHLSTKLTREQKAAARLKKRIAAGVCPCCQRTVSQLARHMADKHPDYVEAHGVPLAAAHAQPPSKKE